MTLRMLSRVSAKPGLAYKVAYIPGLVKLLDVSVPVAKLFGVVGNGFHNSQVKLLFIIKFFYYCFLPVRAGFKINNISGNWILHISIFIKVTGANAVTTAREFF